MAKYSYIFSTEQDYFNAKNAEQSSHPIYDALYSTSSSRKANVSCVSYCQDVDRTYTDSWNVIVPRLEGGAPGDYLLYDTGLDDFCWLKSIAAWNAGSRGGVFGTTASLPTNYKVIGFVGMREGWDTLIFSTATSSLKFSTTGVNPLPAFRGSIRYKGGTTAIYKTGSQTWVEYLCKSNNVYSPYYMPIQRKDWDYICNIIFDGGSLATTTYYTPTGEGLLPWTYEVVNGVGKFHCSIAFTSSSSTDNFIDVNPADYGYSYDRFYRDLVLLERKENIGNYANFMRDSYGKEETSTIIKSTAAPATDYPAANYCYNYAPSWISSWTGELPAKVSRFAAHRWWLPSALALVKMYDNGVEIGSKGASINSQYRTCNPYGTTTTITVNENSSTSVSAVTINVTALPITSFNILLD